MKIKSAKWVKLRIQNLYFHPHYYENRNNGQNNDFGKYSDKNYRNCNHQYPQSHSRKEIIFTTVANENNSNPKRMGRIIYINIKEANLLHDTANDITLMNYECCVAIGSTK